ncbi:hypothetical protein [Synechococcus sp. N32]|uniref:hypothetical protein n=1 Tax=Synechococcus sp. N32 TaxID=2575514 RepID=UPI000E0E0978|nr:hypothetical protein [Synechococcus sp. N32]
MTISSQMQEKIEKIEKLVQDGYTLKKTEYGFIDFRNSSGKPVSIFGAFKSPAGFSWIAFFFPFAVCTQIKEWSYFYINGCLFAIIAVVHGITSYDPNSAGATAIGVTYGYMFPYLRKIAKDNGVLENPKGKSIFVGILLSILSIIPSLIIDTFFGNF